MAEAGESHLDTPDDRPESTRDAKQVLRLSRRVRRLEETLEQLESYRDTNARLLDRLMVDLDAERTRSRELLLNVLPARIVARLDAGESNIADRHDLVAVVMSDLVGFTETAGRLAPGELVKYLNSLFTLFDAACAAHGVEKIKTIGDAYMAVAGLDPSASPDADGGPVAAAAELALDMRDAVQRSGSPWRMRIGIHSGPVVAGVIGSHKFAYDVWGDTVNVASRLETTSLPDRIHVSEPVARALEDRFALEPRGSVELKGKGELATWFLVGRL